MASKFVWIPRRLPIRGMFLAPPEDVRSSNMLEVALTEFECQGLELDWVGVCWGGDFTLANGGCQFRQFKGTAGKMFKSRHSRIIRNKYRVLMTRAREGIVICVPHGSDEDETRRPDGSIQPPSSWQGAGQRHSEAPSGRQPRPPGGGRGVPRSQAGPVARWGLSRWHPR